MGLCEEVLKEFDKRIVALFDEAIDKRVEEIADKRGDKCRREEVANALRIDIRGLAGRMEHGMHVDVRYLEPPAIDGESPAQEDAFQTLGEIQKKLKFDEITAEAFLQIEKPEPETQEPKKSPKAGGGRGANK